MAAARIPLDVHKKILSMKKRKPSLSTREIGRALGIHSATVSDYLKRPLPTPAAKEEIPESVLHFSIKKLLKKDSMHQDDLSNELDISLRRLQAATEEMKATGTMIEFRKLDGHYYMRPAFAAEPGKAEVVAAKSGHGNGEWTHVFGAIGDNHLCNKHSRLDVLNAAYETYARMGITNVYNTGNWVDGEARFNKMELIVRPGMDAQLDYMIDEYPQCEGITTHYIAGDDHEGWYQQREGIEIGRYLQHRAEAAGRTDLKYLGYGEADIALKNGTGLAVMRVVHPGGGSSYAISYTDQKRVESYQSGEKPHIELAGHYHKANYGYPREVHAVQTGCTEDQSMFMRKKKLAAHVGYWVIKIAQDSKGAVSRFAPEWFPFYDRSYYRKDF